MGAGEQREQEPVFISQASQSHRLQLLLIYRLRTPRPRTAPASPAAAIIVWPRPGRAICSARRAAPLPPQARLRAVPNAHPPSPLCNKPTRTPPWLHKDTRKRAQSPARIPAPNPGARKPIGPSKTGPGQQKAHACPSLPTSPRPHLLLCSSPRPCFSFPFPHDPGTPSPFQHLSAVITPPG